MKPSWGDDPSASRARSGAGGSGKPRSSAAGEVSTSPVEGVGVRDSPTASANVAPMTTSSTAATRRNSGLVARTSRCI